MMARSYALFGLLSMLLGGTAGLAGCEPTPDYRITVHDIPSDAALLLIGWKGDDDAVSPNSLAVPISQLGPDDRGSYSIGLSLVDAPDEAGFVSVATVDANGCLTSVTSTEDAPRSSSTRVTMLDVELDPAQNVNVVPRAIVPSPPVVCPPNPPLPPYPDPVACAQVPGLTTMPTEPTLIPTRPVVMTVLRQLRGPAREFDGGEFSFFGWGFDHSSLTFGLTCDPTKCFQAVAMNYPKYLTTLAAQMAFGYPELLPRSYSQLDLAVAQLKGELNVDPEGGFQDAVILCIAVSAASFNLSNPDGASTFYSEILPKM